MDEITLFHYQNRGTEFHSWNPVLKMLTILVFSTMTLLYNIYGMSFLTVFIILILLFSKIRLSEIFLQGRFFLFFMIFILISFSFAGSGRHFTFFYFIKISYDGFFQGILQCWKFALFIACSIFFTSTTNPSDFEKAVFFILKPVPFINHQRLASISGMALVLLPKVLDSYKTLSDALTSRCFYENSSFFTKMKIKGSSLIIINLLKIRDIADAYQARNYDEDSVKHTFNINTKDIILLFLVFIILLSSLPVNYFIF